MKCVFVVQFICNILAPGDVIIYVNVSHPGTAVHFSVPYQYTQSGGIPLALLCFKYHGGASPSPTEGA
jgi:hypothetical protein